MQETAQTSSTCLPEMGELLDSWVRSIPQHQDAFSPTVQHPHCWAAPQSKVHEDRAPHSPIPCEQ